MSENRLLQSALILAIITVGYNLAEGIVSVFFGINDDTLALLGFGIDSFVEVLSGAGIIHMIFRMKKSGQNLTNRDQFEKLALKITGTSFYILAAGLVAGAVINIIRGTKPQTAIVGIIVSAVSILTMYILMKMKLKIGGRLNSDAIIADAHCTRACLYLSFVLLASSGMYELLGVSWFDIAGSLGIAWFAFSEGKEAFEKAYSEKIDCGCHE
ncbi:MAG TPA: cation transporter [Bacteroidales bacterium]|nr:cation transporter [Bacteroidales bacterium]